MSETVVDTPDEKEIKTENIEVEGSKPKKRRRGKKKRFKSQNSDDAKGKNGNEDTEETAGNHVESKKRPKLLIRPVDVPKAPKNSTQFIIDDHDECHLYFSFETPNPYGEGSRTEGVDNGSEDAALQDVDYVYHSMEDVDDTAYYVQDFELSYSKVRYEEFMRLSKPDLVSAIENLEGRVKELEHRLFERDPGSALEQLQRKLLQLQEENIALRETQQHIRKVLAGEESASEELHDSGSEQLQHSSSEQLNDLISDQSSNDSFVFTNFDNLNEDVPLNDSDSERSSVASHLAYDASSQPSYSDDEPLNNLNSEQLNDSDGEPLSDLNSEQLSESVVEQLNDLNSEQVNDSDGEPMNDSCDEQLNHSISEKLDDSGGEQLNDLGGEQLNDSGGEQLNDSHCELSSDSNNEII